ncbi:hypothetical protein [Piscinibacter sp. XHJ-5]|uniref:hypothetical protein n=1 Tax=Piscinibacter sp. XHJ-5 TaxID=3037797 RepID=UPI002453142E|nr:hypothetical protein [Piscinibacter sp. XHJ-5]
MARRRERSTPANGRRPKRLHIACVVVKWLDAELGLAHCWDARGRRYVIDSRSAVSISALRPELALMVEATDGGVVKYLVLDDQDAPRSVAPVKHRMA